jgi:hypothetical protein
MITKKDDKVMYDQLDESTFLRVSPGCHHFRIVGTRTPGKAHLTKKETKITNRNRMRFGKTTKLRFWDACVVLTSGFCSFETVACLKRGIIGRSYRTERITLRMRRN